MSLQRYRRIAYWLIIACLAAAAEFSTASLLRPRPTLSQPAPESTTSSDRDRLYERGLQLQEAGQYHEAIDALQQALRSIRETGDTPAEGDRQQQAKILNQIGNAYLSLEEYDLASEYYAQAIEVRQAEQSPVHNRSDPQANLPSGTTRALTLQIPDIAATGVALSGGTRGAVLSGYELTAVLPETNFGFTTIDYPKVFVSAAEPLDGVAAEFVVAAYAEDRLLEPIYVVTRSLTLPTSGVFGIDFAALEGMPALEVGTRYRWRLALISNPDRPSQSAIATGEIERVGGNERHDASGSVDTVYAYAEAGIWYNAVATLYELRQQGEAPNGLWPGMLRLAELDNLVGEPLLGDWSNLFTVEVSKESTTPIEKPEVQSISDSSKTSSNSPPDIGMSNPPVPGGSR